MTDYRPLLFSVAYNMLGDRAEAEDVVQDVLLRWEEAAKERIENAKGYLVKSTVNTAINSLNSAHKKRLTYPNIWLPEPLPDAIMQAADAPGETRTILTYELMVLTRELSPVELAVFILKEAFNYSHEEIGEILGKRTDHCRQMFKRAKEKIQKAQLSPAPLTESDLRLAEQVVSAISEGNVEGLVSLLNPDIRLMADGGGKAAASPTPILGAARVAHVLTTAARKIPFTPRVEVVPINGQPGFVVYNQTQAVAAYVLTAVDRRVARMYVMLNPDKLRAFPKG